METQARIEQWTAQFNLDPALLDRYVAAFCPHCESFAKLLSSSKIAGFEEWHRRFFRGRTSLIELQQHVARFVELQRVRGSLPLSLQMERMAQQFLDGFDGLDILGRIVRWRSLLLRIAAEFPLRAQWVQQNFDREISQAAVRNSESTELIATLRERIAYDDEQRRQMVERERKAEAWKAAAAARGEKTGTAREKKGSSRTRGSGQAGNGSGACKKGSARRFDAARGIKIRVLYS